MSIHKLPAERDGRATDVARFNITLQEDMYSLGDAIVRARAAQNCDFDLRALPVYRILRWSVRRKLAEFFDDLALDAAFVSQRVREGLVLLSAPGVFVHAQGQSKGTYTSCWLSLWAESRVRADEMIGRL